MTTAPPPRRRRVAPADGRHDASHRSRRGRHGWRAATPRDSRLLAVALLAATALLGACAPPAQPLSPGWTRHDLTRDGSDTTRLVEVGDRAVDARAAATNVGHNSRTIFHRSDGPVSAGQESCMRYRNSGGIAQEGIALRISPAGGGVRAVTVTKNIWANATWYFNVHTWDTTSTPILRQHASFDMRDVVGGPQRDATWSTCARMDGGTLRFKVWTGDEEPDWGGPETRQIEVPDAPRTGRAGWYVGHVQPGQWSRFDRLETRRHR